MVELSEEDFKKLGQENTIDLEEEREKIKQSLTDCYRNIQDLLKKYCDLKKEYYTIIPLWIIGTYTHQSFISYPFLYLNAMRGSGKTRLLKLITSLSHNGEMLNSLTEAVLFRTRGTLGIDEYEGITRKGSENLRELLNSAYKKGTKVKRMKKVKTIIGEEQVVEEFDVYRPIVMANIWGIEEVLSDRCLTLILERSAKQEVTNLVEVFKDDLKHKTTRTTLTTLFDFNPKNPEKCSLCSVVVAGECIYERWNDYIINYFLNSKHITTQLHEQITPPNYTESSIKYVKKDDFLFEKVRKMGLDGRSLELAFPLILIAQLISPEVMDEAMEYLSEMLREKKEDFSLESKDISFIDFISQQEILSEGKKEFISISHLTQDFKMFLHEEEVDLPKEEKWLNTKWIGRALKRLNLIKEKKRTNKGIEVILDIEKAQDKIKMFK